MLNCHTKLFKTVYICGYFCGDVSPMSCKSSRGFLRTTGKRQVSENVQVGVSTLLKKIVH